jgi:hypothetical protein
MEIKTFLKSARDLLLGPSTGMTRKKTILESARDMSLSPSETAGSVTRYYSRSSQYEPPVLVSFTEANYSVVTAKIDVLFDDEDKTSKIRLPTPIELSKELCKIVVDTADCNSGYSRDKSIRALKNIYNWAGTKDYHFLKYFHTYGGVLKLLDFLTETIKDPECVGSSILMKCIVNAANVITSVTHPGKNGINEEITTKIAITLMDCNGIHTLINASEECTPGDEDAANNNTLQLSALCSVWLALRNTTCKKDPMKDTISKAQAITLFDTGINIIFQLKSVDGPIVSETLEHVFITLHSIVFDSYITTEYFHSNDKDILSKCSEVFIKQDNDGNKSSWEENSRRSENAIKCAIHFFNCCRIKELLDRSSDYEILLPLLAIGLKTFPSNNSIRNNTLLLLNSSCSIINDKKIIKDSDVIGVLGELLNTSSDSNINVINFAERIRIHNLIVKIRLLSLWFCHRLRK